MTSMMVNVSRNDLGFIPNKRTHLNRSMLYAPLGPQQRRVPSQQQQVSSPDDVVEQQDVKQQSAPPTSRQQGMIHMRTEYLESQERKLTASYNEQKSSLSSVSQKVDSLEGSVKDMFVSLQSVKGFSDEKLLSSPSLEDAKHGSLLEKEGELAGKWHTLFYPMEEVNLEGGEKVVLMRRRKVDPVSGQLGHEWVRVFSEKEGERKRHISRFDL